MGNLKKHLARYHDNEYEIVVKEESEAGPRAHQKEKNCLSLLVLLESSLFHF
jgi:hypothetical protein